MSGIEALCICSRRPGTGQGPEHLFAGAADRTFPVLREIRKRGPFGDLALSVAFVRVVDIAAIDGLTLIHFFGVGHYYLL